MTPEQAAAYEVNAEYERENRIIKRHDEVFAARINCKARHMVWWLDGFTTFEIKRMSRDENWLPRHASTFNFSCLTAGETERVIKRAMGGGYY